MSENVHLMCDLKPGIVHVAPGIEITFLCANNEKIKAHVQTLLAQSKFFRDNFTKPDKQVCLVPQYNVKIMKMFLELIKNGEIRSSPDDIKKVIEVADNFWVKYHEFSGAHVGQECSQRVEDDDKSLIFNLIPPIKLENSMESVQEAGSSSEMEMEQSTSTPDITSVTPKSEKYIHLLTTASFKTLHNFCIICNKFFMGIEQHIESHHRINSKTSWKCDLCRKAFLMKNVPHKCLPKNN